MMNDFSDVLRSGLVIHLYTDIDQQPGHGRTLLHFPARDKPYIAEDVCFEAAKHLNISSRSFPLFGLVKYDLSLWERPNHEIATTGKMCVEYRFRIRYRPNRDFITALSRNDQNSDYMLEYYYYQCRSDFVNGALDIELKNDDGSSKDDDVQRGLGALSIYCFCRKNNIMHHKDFFEKRICKEASYFIPQCTVKQIDGLLSSKRLKNGLKDSVKQLMSTLSNLNYKQTLSRYIFSLWHHFAPDYGSESYAIADSLDRVIVNVHDPKSSGISVHGPEQKQPEHYCTIDDLTSLSYSAYEGRCVVVVNRKSGHPKQLLFESEPKAFSFMAYLDGAYRLTTDWQHHLNDLIVSPLLNRLKRVRCYGPVAVKWAFTRLIEHCERTKCDMAYLLSQDVQSLLSYILYLQGRDTYIRIVTLPNGHLQLANMENEPIFPSLDDLISHYRNVNHSLIRILHPVPLRPPYDLAIYLCRPETIPSRPVSMPNGLSLSISGIRIVPAISYDETACLGNGLLTTCYRGTIGEEKTVVAVKRLSHAQCGAIELLAGIHSTAFCQHVAIMSVKALCMNPFSFALDLAPLGDLTSYLRGQCLKVYDGVLVVEQISEALRYLHEEYLTHGNIRAGNVLVFAHNPGQDFQVKLADVGMVNMYNTHPLEHEVNLQRLPWIAPEMYSDLTKISTYTDVYAFGTTLWEIFSGGNVPFDQSCDMSVVLSQILDGKSLDVLLPVPNTCPPDIANLMKSCWDVVPDARKTPKELLRDILSVKSHADLAHDLLPGKARHEYSLAANGKAHEVEGATGGVDDLQSTMLPATLSSPHADGMRLTQLLLQGQEELHAESDKLSNRPLPALPLLKPNFIQPQDLIFSKTKLGEGHYGLVHLGKHQGQDVAIKTLKKDMYERFQSDFQKELKNMISLDHVNIVKVLGYSRSLKHPMSLVLEYLTNGCLLKYLRKHKKVLERDMSNLLRFSDEICSGMLYLSSRDPPLVHCDLASRNVLVSSNLVVKISDFGLSRALDPDKDYYRQNASKEIPVHWCAPEVLEFKKYTERSDVWSFGVTLWEIFSCGEIPSLLTPEQEKDQRFVVWMIKAIKMGTRLLRPPHCPERVYALMNSCWRYDVEFNTYTPDKRASFTTLKVELTDLCKDAKQGVLMRPDLRQAPT